MTHYFSKQSWGNCWWIAFRLTLAGRAEIILLRKTGKLAYHPIVQLKSGRLVHWSIIPKGRKFWKFACEGRPHIMRARELRKEKYLRCVVGRGS